MLQIKPNHVEKLLSMGSWPESMHIFDEESIWAVNAAFAAERPLLVRGEPGTGKSQLARAAAMVLKRLFVSEVVHPGSESQDLQWHFDAVTRLGEAQALGASGNGHNISEKLDHKNFLSPGALWWALDWESADRQYEICGNGTRKPEKPEGWKPEQGSVLLIDEIDKADANLPNGLLETLGNGAFTVPYLDKPIGLSKNCPPPLVIITTNEERELPAAFVRRCMVLHLNLPKEEGDFIKFLTLRGKIHFQDRCKESVRIEAARQLYKDRSEAYKSGLPVPGQAEYLDLLRAVCSMGKTETEQLKILEKISAFALKKHPGE